MKLIWAAVFMKMTWANINILYKYDLYFQSWTNRLRQNGHHFVDNIFKSIFLYKNCYILVQISMKYVPKGSIKNMPALIQIRAQWPTSD